MKRTVWVQTEVEEDLTLDEEMKKAKQMQSPRIDGLHSARKKEKKKW